MVRQCVSIKFRDSEKGEVAYIVDGHSTKNGVLELYTYTSSMAYPTKIQIFLLSDIEEINITGVTI